MQWTIEQPQQLFLGGEWVPAISGKSYEIENPFSKKKIARAAAANRDDVRRAIEAAAAAFRGWAATPPSARRDILLKIADRLEARASEFGSLHTEEMGAAGFFGLYSATMLARKFRSAAGHTHRGATGVVLASENPGRTSLLIRKPVGTVAAVVPWNAPVLLFGNAVPVALAVGNTVVVRGAEQTPRCLGLVVEVMREAGLPAGVVNLITNSPADGPEVIDELVTHPKVQRIHFTGSSRVGAIIAEKAGRLLKRVTLELGGKNQMIVLADADIDRAASAAAFGSFFANGQGCLCTDRVVIDRSVQSQFTEKLIARAKNLKHGDPTKPDTAIGPLINAAAMSRVTSLVEDAVTKGAKVLLGGKPEGSVFPPTILTNIKPTMRYHHEEAFAPLVNIVAVDGVEEALAVANDSNYGLSSSIFSRDIVVALDIAKRLNVGMTHINGATPDFESDAPFGGVKNSGYGKTGGDVEIDEFTELQWITVEGTTPPAYPF